MKASYKLILLANAEPGMVLSDNLLDRYGKVLLPRETVLTEKMLDSLSRHDIDMIPIVGDPMSEEERAAEIQAQQERLAHLFRKHNYGNADMYVNDVLLACLKAFHGGEK